MTAVGLLVFSCSGQHPNVDREACKNYVECCYKMGGTGDSCGESTFGAMGTCWTSDNPAAAASCEKMCQATLDAYKDGGIGVDAGCNFR